MIILSIGGLFLSIGVYLNARSIKRQNNRIDDLRDATASKISDIGDCLDDTASDFGKTKSDIMSLSQQVDSLSRRIDSIEIHNSAASMSDAIHIAREAKELASLARSESAACTKFIDKVQEVFSGETL